MGSGRPGQSDGRVHAWQHDELPGEFTGPFALALANRPDALAQECLDLVFAHDNRLLITGGIWSVESVHRARKWSTPARRPGLKGAP